MENASQILFKYNVEFVELFVKEVRKRVKSAKHERTPILVNTLPVFLTHLAETLEPGNKEAASTDQTTIAQEHGSERARITRYSPEELIEEIHLLREMLLNFVHEKKPLTMQEAGIIRLSCDKMMSDSLISYFLVQSSIQERLTNTLTHDLRNPLSAIKANAQLIIKNPSKADQHMTLANRIVSSIDRMDRMIQDVLDASLVRSGEKLSFKYSPAELHSIAKETIDELATIYGDRFTLTGEEIHGFWNADSLKRAIENLCTNAIKYGDPTKPISLTIKEILGRAILSVHNEGSYIPMEEQESLFKAFMRGKNTQDGEKKGWGIGLALVRGVVEGHAGSIIIESSIEGGTTFTMDFLVDPRLIDSN